MDRWIGGGSRGGLPGVDLYQGMMFLTTAAVLAGVFAIAWSFWAWSWPARPGAFLSETRAVVRALAGLSVVCALLALAVGVRLFGIRVVLDTLRSTPDGFRWFLLWTTVGLSGLGILSGRQQERARGRAERERETARVQAEAANAPRTVLEEEPRVVIRQRGKRKVLWQMAAASLEGADLFHADLRGADLRGADLSGADLRGADLRRARLGKPEMAVATEIAWAWCAWILTWLVIYHDQVSRHQSGAALTGPMIYWCLAATYRIKAEWRGAIRAALNLRSAVFEAADLRGAALQGATLTGARYDDRTRWPGGFDPEARGAVRVRG
jgi:hypothetical protein